MVFRRAKLWIPAFAGMTNTLQIGLLKMLEFSCYSTN